MAAYDQSLLYHSIRFYDGTYTYRNVSYRIGNNTSQIREEFENYYDTWDNFRLIPTERPVVALPKANTKIVNVPGRRDPIDLTTYLTGHPRFGNRTGSWTFLTDPDFVKDHGGWVAFDKDLRSHFHGHVSKVVLRDDPSYFYVGELSMNPWQPGESRSSVTINYNLYPYKKEMISSMELWKFDTFDFKDGIITYLKDIQINGSGIIKLYGSRERISPHISGSSGLLIDKYENSTWVSYGSVPTDSISSAKSIVPRLIIDDGLNQLRIRGTGLVTIDYRRGLL